MGFKLPKLNYAYNALEPYLDEKTIEIHYSKHHKAYTDNLNNAIINTELENLSIEEILVKGFDIPKIRNNAGGFYNHNLLWEIIYPNQGIEKPKEKLLELLNMSFENFDNFKRKFTEIAINKFGSGWVWLCKKENKLNICATSNQDNPLMPNVGCSGNPILGLDIWEHAYYLKYQNRRLDYIKNFFKVINWEVVASKLN